MKVSRAISWFFFTTIVSSAKCFLFAYINQKYGLDDINIIQASYLEPIMKIYQDMQEYLDNSGNGKKQCHRAFVGLQPVGLGLNITTLNKEMKKTLISLKTILSMGNNENNTQPEFKKIVDAVLEKYLKPVDDVYHEYEAMETKKFTRTGLSVKFKSLSRMILGNDSFPILRATNQFSKNIHEDIFHFPFFDPEWRQCDKFDLMQNARYYLYLRIIFTEFRAFYMTLHMCAITLFINDRDCNIYVTQTMIDAITVRINNYIRAIYDANMRLQPQCDCLRSPETLRSADRYGTIKGYIRIPNTKTDVKSFRVFTNLTEHICFNIAGENSADNGWQVCYGEDLNTQDVIRKGRQIVQIIPIKNKDRFNEIMMRQFTVACSKNVWTISYTERNNTEPMGKLSFNESCAFLSHYTLTSPHVRNNSFLWFIPDVGYQTDQYSPLVRGQRGCYCHAPPDEETFTKLVQSNTTRVCRTLSSDGFDYVEHLLENNGQLTEDLCIPKDNSTFSNLKSYNWTLYSGCPLPKPSSHIYQSN